MNLSKLKELAVPVSERLPEKEENYIVVFIFDKKEWTGHAYLNTWGSNERLFWVVRGAFIGEDPIVTHWIDFDLLTTKAKALELAERALVHGMHIESGHTTKNMEQFITENQNKL